MKSQDCLPSTYGHLEDYDWRDFELLLNLAGSQTFFSGDSRRLKLRLRVHLPSFSINHLIDRVAKISMKRPSLVFALNLTIACTEHHGHGFVLKTWEGLGIDFASLCSEDSFCFDQLIFGWPVVWRTSLF